MFCRMRRLRKEILALVDMRFRVFDALCRRFRACLASATFGALIACHTNHFWRLHSILAPKITAARLKVRRYLPKGGQIGWRGGRYKLPPIRNGHISTSVRLACALRYFAGSLPYDVMVT